MAADDITVNNLRQLMRIQTELGEQAETKWRKAQRALVEVLEAFAQEEVDQRLKAGRPVDSLGVDELVQLIRQAAEPRPSQAQTLMRENRSARALQELQEQNTKLQGDLKESRAETVSWIGKATQFESKCSALLSENAALKQSVPLNRESEIKPESGENSMPDHKTSEPPEPVWLAEWRQTETFERDASILKMIGETGLARRPLVEARASELLGIKKAGGSIQALMSRLADLNLVEIFRPWSSDGAGTGGKLPGLLRLNDRGQMAYWLLTGSQPRINEYDLLLERHVSPEHTLLNLQAADLLREAGYQVNQTPAEIKLPDGGLFKPDLVIIDEQGALLFVEVERDTVKNIEGRQAKWWNFYQASGGHLYVVCDNRPCMRNIRSEINFCLGNKACVISLTNLVELQAGKRGEGDSIWLEVKQKGN